MSKIGQYVQHKQSILDDARAKNVPVADILEHMGNQATDFISAWERFIETEKGKQQWFRKSGIEINSNTTSKGDNNE